MDSSKIFRLIATLAASLLLGMVGTTAAFADDSASLPAYGGPGGSDQGTVDQGTPPATCVPGTTGGTTGGDTGGTTGGGTTGGGTTMGTDCGQPAPSQLVAPATTPGTAVLPADESGGNEVLGARAGGGSLPAKASAPSTASAPAAAAAPAAAKASHRLVGSLPFTGFDVIVLAMVGLALLGLGIGLRRLVSSPQIG